MIPNRRTFVSHSPRGALLTQVLETSTPSQAFTVVISMACWIGAQGTEVQRVSIC